MKARLGIALATALALGTAALMAATADAQQAAPPAAPQPPAAEARPMPPPGAQGQRQMGPQGGILSQQDRAAFFDAHIAAIKAGLELTPDQQKLWDPVEQAVRDAIKEMRDERQKLAAEGRPTDPMERLQRMADVASARGDALHKLASAAQPLYASLTDDQKRRLPILLRAGMPQQGQRQRMRGMMQQFMPENGGPRGGQE